MEHSPDARRAKPRCSGELRGINFEFSQRRGADPRVLVAEGKAADKPRSGLAMIIAGVAGANE
jgi:hypothetical protein